MMDAQIADDVLRTPRVGAGTHRVLMEQRSRTALVPILTGFVVGAGTIADVLTRPIRGRTAS